MFVIISGHIRLATDLALLNAHASHFSAEPIAYINYLPASHFTPYSSPYLTSSTSHFHLQPVLITTHIHSSTLQLVNPLIADPTSLFRYYHEKA